MKPDYSLLFYYEHGDTKNIHYSLTRHFGGKGGAYGKTPDSSRCVSSIIDAMGSKNGSSITISVQNGEGPDFRRGLQSELFDVIVDQIRKRSSPNLHIHLS